MTLKIPSVYEYGYIMKKLMLSATVFLCLWLPDQPAEAAYLTGNQLLKECEGEKAQIQSCMNYVAGVIDYQVMQQSLGTEPSVDFCLSDDASLEKVTVIVMFYLKKNPQLGSFIAAPSVTMAMHEAYPCGPPPASKKKHKHAG